MSKHTTLEQLKLAQQRTKLEVGKVEKRVEDLEKVGAQANVFEGLELNGTALPLVSKIASLVFATGTQNGTFKVNDIEVAIKGLAALAYKSEISADDLAAALKKQIDDNSSAISTLNGTGAGSVTKTVDDAIDEFAKKISDDGVVNTFKELVDWVASHGAEAAEMAGAISALQDKVVLGTHEVDGEQVEYATVKQYVEAVIAGLGMNNYYTKTEVDTALGNKVDKVDGKGLSTNDFTDAYKGQLDGLDTALSGKVDKVQGKGLSTNDFTDEDKTKLDNIETATNDEVNAMLNEVWGTTSGD